MDGEKSYNTQSEILISCKEKYNHNIQRQMDRTVENTKYILQSIKDRCCKLSLNYKYNSRYGRTHVIGRR